MIKGNWRWTPDINAEILSELTNARAPIVHVCNGSSMIGDARLDRYINPDNPIANIRADMRTLPIKSGIAGAVICDPPYDWKHGKDWIHKLISELARITAPGCKMMLIAPWVLQHPTLQPVRFALRPAGPRGFPSYKILSVSIKYNSQIEDYL